MSGTTKRLDLQFGVFACSVQGFDDPVQPVRQVLQALQSLLEETPEIADAGISFDAEAIERLVGEVARRADIDEENVEIVPGLIIVHRGGGNAATGEPEAFDARYDEGDGGEAWSQPFVAGAADSEIPGSEPADAETSDAAEGAAPGFINIFKPGGHGDADAGYEPDTEPDAADDHFAKDAPLRDIFAATGEDTGGGVFADPMAANIGEEPEDGSVDEGTPLNLFAAPDQGDERDDDPGDVGPENLGNVFASVDSADAGPEATAPEDTGREDPDEPGEDSERVETLFGRSEDQPAVEEAEEGYTAAGLAQTAGAETVADLMVSAAAWMVLIQGQTTFTRREVVAVFEAMPGEHSKTLEARVKGFGKAVRNSQLVMVEDGVFGLSRIELERFQRLL
jgi:hypothetical protein